MDNPIFRKLKEAIEHPCRSKEWFGLAEQGINTVYALGEHPDAFCDDLLKKLTIRAFARRTKLEGNAESSPPDAERPAEKDSDAMVEDHPGDDTQQPDDTIHPTQEGSQQDKDLGDAFQLSQLLFAVGHVAIKHIVFLELVEREWKRQKDEKQAGLFWMSI